MTSDRMMQAIGRIERAISRLEAATARDRDGGTRQGDEIARLTAALGIAEGRNADLKGKVEEQERELRTLAERQSAPALPDQDPHAMNPFSHDKALAALRSLDSLIDDLQKARRDG